ncbi:MAG: class I poly(R)-hydroxyalkanoic acid synthase [Chelatococcus sp.]|nr:MAG: class I poly(R)-hydroxyalkanoic acid synthase [Chelatococcus sp.]
MNRPVNGPEGEEQQASEREAPDLDQFAQNMGRLIEEYGKATAAYLKPIERGEAKTGQADEASDMVRTLGRVAERWVSDPKKIIEAQASITGDFLSLWSTMLKRAGGEEPEPVAKPDKRDARFSDPDWSEHPMFDFIKQAYLIGTRWAEAMVDRAEDLDPHTREKARFYVKQISSALSPTNFVATNPELLRETLRQNGENLVRGMKMLAEDIEAGRGELKIRQSDPSAFEIGVNIATTPGKVVFRDEIMELIQYAPATPQVLKRPLLIVPPWINKYYILDLNPEKSFIRWCVEQGLTVFCISWVNPDQRHAAKDFESYMREGIFAALDAIAQATGERSVATIGYCVGGTLLGITLAYMAATGDDRVASATFFTTQVDFSEAGELSVFVDEDQIRAIEEQMTRSGYLEGARMSGAFNMLRPNDLIWSYAVNNYLKGKMPTAFDLLYWNSDSTRMPAANHSFYLRNCYLDNKLTKGQMHLGGTQLDLKRVTIPVYNLATREDHIAPARSVFNGSKCFGGEVEYVVSGSGHIAGVVNPPSRGKYQYWTGGKPTGRYHDWMTHAEEHPGSWWPHWFAWLEKQAPERVPAREPGGGKLAPIEDAPGSYVKVRS